MPDLQQQTERREARIRRIADEACRRAKGFDGWRSYEAAKGYVRRQHGAHVPGYDAIMDHIKDRLGI
jgi:hypothetical protein